MAVARNVGDASGESTIVNMVVANVFGLMDDHGNPAKESGNPIAGKHTNNDVTFLSGERRFFPNMTWMNPCTLLFNNYMPAERNVEHEIVFIIEDHRFSTSGVRWLPSHTFPLDEHTTTTKVWRRVRALPHDEVVCGPGYRRSTRRIRIVDPPDERNELTKAG
jgi:hypothetical protein